MTGPSQAAPPDRPEGAENQPTIPELQRTIASFVADRDWDRYHAPGNLAASILIEAAELLEHFQWAAPTGEEPASPPDAADLADELADILIYCLAFANRTGIDPAQAVLDKLARNEGRFPPGHDPFAKPDG